MKESALVWVPLDGTAPFFRDPGVCLLPTSAKPREARASSLVAAQACRHPGGGLEANQTSHAPGHLSKLRRDLLPSKWDRHVGRSEV